MFRLKLIIFLIIPVFSQVQRHAGETSRHAAPSAGWTTLQDDRGNTYKYWAGGKREDAAASSSVRGDLTAVVREGDLIAVHGTRPRRRPVHAEPSGDKHAPARPQRPHPTTTTTTTERPKTTTTTVRPKTTAHARPSETGTAGGPGPELVGPTGEIPPSTVTTPAPSARKTEKTDQPTPTTTTTTTTSRPPTASDGDGPLLELWPTAAAVPGRPAGCDGRDSAGDDVGPTTDTETETATEPGGRGCETDDGNGRVVGPGPRPCDGRDEFVLLVENDVRLKLVVDSRRASSGRRSAERDGDGDPPVASRADDEPADAAETDERPDDGGHDVSTEGKPRETR